MFVALFLVTWANGAPVLVRLVLGRRWRRPVDGGRLFVDGRPWLGTSKTWRGWGATLLTTPLLAVLLGVSVGAGLAAAVAAMLGDAMASFIKRRLGWCSTESAPLLDQIPESLLPALVLREPLGLSSLDVLCVVLGFFIIDTVLTPLAGKIEAGLRRSS